MSTQCSRVPSVSPPPSKRRKTKAPVDGDEPFDAGGPGNISVYSWNVNGIAPFVQPAITSFFSPIRSEAAAGRPRSAQTTSLRETLRRNGWPTMLFLQEVKINPDDVATTKAVERAVLPTHDEPPNQPRYKVFFCLPSDRYNAQGFGRRVYGVCSMIREDFCDRCVARVREVDWDAEGRFLVVETKAVGSIPRLAIFNIYAVSRDAQLARGSEAADGPSSMQVNGTDAPYKDSAQGHVVGTRHDRKVQVHKLLHAECQALEAKGVGMILAGDMNIARAPIDGFPNLRTFPNQHVLNRADFETRFFVAKNDSAALGEVSEADVDKGLNLVDTFRSLNPTRAGYTYYPRGKAFGSSCDRVDMILTSQSLRAQLMKADILETVADRGPSDHVPLYIHLSFGSVDPVAGDVEKQEKTSCAKAGTAPCLSA